ncbi:MAG: large-conductance mechanosensitive channel protein MscL [Sciscionella sp.]
MLKGFKEFIMRGNIMDLAIAVVIGTAFTAVVTAITTSLIKPLINSIGGGKVGGIGFHIVGTSNATYVDLAAIINAIINFLIIAAVVYFALVLPMKKMADRRRRRLGIEETVEPTDVELLSEIRDLLREQQTGAGTGGAHEDE